MAWIEGGSYRMGSDRHYAEEAPVHAVTVDGFWIDCTTVTNAEFARFVHETGYVTVAERPVDPALFPGADPALLEPSSVVFRKPTGPVDMRNYLNWWSYVRGADWRHPEGPDSSIDERADHPVVQVALEDVEAYAAFAGKSVPTEAEWEFAARGGLDGAEFAWGDEFMPGGKPQANTWQGNFPLENLLLDGFERTAPVRSFPPNGYGLYEVTGNVWEWTCDWFEDRHRVQNACCGDANPRGGRLENSFDPTMPQIRIGRKVIKGGSYLCAPNYCRRYRPAARIAHAIDTGTCHIGFRLIERSPGNESTAEESRALPEE